MSRNKVQLIGNLGRDPEIRRMQNGDPVATLRIATSETWRDKTSGEKKERTEWHQVVIFGQGLCDVVEKYVKKGHKVFLEGQLQTRKWTDQQGVERYTTEVVLRPYAGELIMLTSSGGGRPPAPDGDSYGADAAAPSPGGGSGAAYSRSAMDDDIPFAPEWR